MSTRAHLDAMFGEQTGWVFIGLGTGQYVADTGKVRHEHWAERSFRWPDQADEIVEHITREAEAGADVYFTPSLSENPVREKPKNAKHGRKPRFVHCLWADLDDNWSGLRVAELRGRFFVYSGSEGRRHLYVPLVESAPPDIAEDLLRRLAAYVGGDPSVAWHGAYLRPVGTKNWKPTTLTGEPPSNVEFALEPSTPVWSVDDLDDLLPPVEATVVTGDIPDTEPVDDLPDWLEQIITEPVTTGMDRSKRTMAAVGACRRAYLTDGQIITVMRRHAPTVEKYNGRADEEVTRALAKIPPELDGNRSTPTPPPVEPVELTDLLDTLRSYLHLAAGHDHFLFALAVAVAARASKGEPLWGLIVGPASSGKTEAVRMLDDIADEHPDELTAPGLLSWTKGKEARQVGILRRIPNPGLLTVGDFSTVLATSDRGGRDQLFALLRRAYDGRVHRDLGNAPGPLTWSGRLTLLAACTPIIDSYSTHTDALGPRWLYCRVGDQTAATKRRTGRKALQAGELDAYRTRVRAIAAGLVTDAIARYPIVELSEAAEKTIVDAAIVCCYGRAGVERYGYGRREISGMAIIEEPPRLVIQTAQLARALIALRFDEHQATTLACRCALDSMPRARYGALEALTSQPQASIGEIARRSGCHRHVARMALEELDAIGVARCLYDEDETTDVNFAARPWVLREEHAVLFRATFSLFTRGTKSGEHPAHTLNPPPPQETAEESQPLFRAAADQGNNPPKPYVDPDDYARAQNPRELPAVDQTDGPWF
jgi:hypothetical protein